MLGVFRNGYFYSSDNDKDISKWIEPKVKRKVGSLAVESLRPVEVASGRNYRVSKSKGIRFSQTRQYLAPGEEIPV